MHLGMIGMGRMGGNMAERLRAAGHTVIGYDQDPALSDVDSLAALVDALPAPRAVWVMVPAGDPTRATLDELSEVLSEGDLVVEGGNSHFEEDRANAARLAERGIHYVDTGVSGGVWGKDVGYGLMVGGSTEDVERLMPIYEALRPEGPREEGFVHAGPVGAGHFTKMVHNGIEYGLMQAYAEGYELMHAHEDLVDDPGAVLNAWRRGTVVRSWLLDLMVLALEDDPDLDAIRGYVEDSGEGRWTIDAAIDAAVPVPAISASLFARFTSRQEDSPAMRMVAAMRNQFGAHATRPAEDPAGEPPVGPAAS
ncbi:phosphogluconate dehydrogenase (NAD(+)-dependent, decarboxylating) [Georgenia sp. Z1491]|uniref:phosphogluconate dehydrogenase (NAD(+)-dependent, decarboxylating) n=1 Tax=Georgenia sp. Z1491 TaxID=3416707 RepID=UPI003CFA4A0F